jgi:twinfilin-like protein
MTSSGINVSSELKTALLEAQSGQCFAIKIQIKGDSFAIMHNIEDSSDVRSNWSQMRNVLDEKLPCFIICRSVRTQGKWILVFYCPGSAKVRDRMVYASSLNELKSGFGSSLFVEKGDYHVTTPAECVYDDYVQTLADYDPRELMTEQEAERLQSEFQAAMSSGGGKRAVVVQMKMKVHEALPAALDGLRDGSHNTVIISIERKTESFQLIATGNYDVKAVVQQMGDAPLFIVHNFSFIHQDVPSSKLLFIYYCPEALNAKIKMTFSSAKSSAVSLCNQHGLENFKNFELSDGKDLSDEYIYSDLYPAEVTTSTFAKPKSKAKGARRMIGGAKTFDA